MSSCYANPTPAFQPAMRIISSINNGNPTAITTSFDHNYVSGEIVRIVIPSIFGISQINGQTGTITVTGSTTFTINIDSTTFDLFSAPSPLPSAYTCPQVIPIGEISSILTAATNNTLG